MKYRSVRQLFLLVLGVLAALGMGMSTVASSDFAMGNVQAVAMMDDMAAVDCRDSGKSKPCEFGIPCAAICAGPGMSLPPSAALLGLVALGPDFVLLAARPLVGSSAPPELSPPRTTYIA